MSFSCSRLVYVHTRLALTRNFTVKNSLSKSDTTTYIGYVSFGQTRSGQTFDYRIDKGSIDYFWAKLLVLQTYSC